MRWGLLVVLAGCDKVLGLTAVESPFAPSSGTATIAAGTGHSCWLDSQGTIWCWGENDNGEVGAGSVQPEVDALAPIDDNRYLQISAKHKHTCAIRDDHTLWCWGASSDGRLGLGTTTADRYSSPVQVGASTWLAVAASAYHTCAIDSARALWCWGNDGAGQLGDGGGADHQYAPVEIAAGATYAAVAVGTYHTCAIRLDGTLECWGANSHGQVGDGSTETRATPTAIGTEMWRAIAAGFDHSCGVTASGHLRCWGHNQFGQLGSSTLGAVQSPAPVLVDGTDRTDWAGVAANANHTCAWTVGGAGYCFGDSSHGELGTADGVNMTALPIDGTWSAFALGETHVCAVDAARAVSCAGGNGWGQLGQGPTAVLTPHKVGTAAWDRVYAGATATCAVTGAGSASCGGNNLYGQLGDTTQTSRTALAPVAGGHGWNSLAVGDTHVCAIEATLPELVWCWGRNDNGESAHSYSPPITMPETTTVVGPSATATIAMSASDHTCAAVLDPPNYGTTFCWGNNDNGQLGDGSTMGHAAPEAIPNPPGAIGVYSVVGAGGGFTCGRVTNGSLWCWGRGNNRMNPTQMDATAAQPESAAVGMSQVFAGGSHACALDNSVAGQRQAYCWGYNGEGQLGFPPAGDVATPTAIPMHYWSTLALGTVHTCGIESSTSFLWCWGDNRRGQAGNGDPLRGSVETPALVNMDQWRSVAAGAFHTCAVDMASDLYCWGSDDDGALLDGHGWETTMMIVDVPP